MEKTLWNEAIDYKPISSRGPQALQFRLLTHTAHPGAGQSAASAESMLCS